MMIYCIIALVNHVKELWVVKLDMSFLIVNILCYMIMLLDCEKDTCTCIQFFTFRICISACNLMAKVFTNRGNINTSSQMWLCLRCAEWTGKRTE